MKKLLIICFLFVSQLDYVHAENDVLSGFFNDENVACHDLVDVSISEYDNLKVYHIMCNSVNGSVRIYNYTPQQTVMTYYIEKMREVRK